MLSGVDRLLATAQTGRILREGLETVIIGKPNVGKSSLLNALLREKRAIVTDIPGTTRDVIEDIVNLRGIPLKIMDTAGIRDTDDLVERLGVERTRELIGRAGLLLLILDASQPLTIEDRQIFSLMGGRPAIVLINKSDLSPRLEVDEVEELAGGQKVMRISVLEGSGLEQLEEEIAGLVYAKGLATGEGAFVSNVRQQEALRQAKNYLLDVIAAVDLAMPPDCLVIDLRAAWVILGEVTGDTVGDDILDRIFSTFCIGK